MSSLQLELDPVEIRQSLEASRAKRLSFDEAWKIATKHRKPSVDDRSLYRFMEKHFRAAYYNNSSDSGRCFIPDRDVSNALVLAQHHPMPSNNDHCRSGDGCDRLATHGRFGKHFCEHHARELERIAAKMEPRRYNECIFGTAGAKAA